MSLGDGYSVEEQLTGEGEWGGLQISVVPLKAHVWKAEWENTADMCFSMSPSMGLASGGRMRQVIYPDPFKLEDWDVAAADRVFVTLIHAKDWKKVTGEAAPNEPPSAKDYSRVGLPWFEHYGKDQSGLPGSETLAGVESVGDLFTQITGATLPNSEHVETGIPKAVGPGAKVPRPVRTPSWDQ
jgi:hypothetical protein